MASLHDRIEAHALLNAVRHGEARPQNVLPKILGEFPEQKARVKDLLAEIGPIVARVNDLAPDERQIRLDTLAPDLLEKKQVKERDLPPLPNAVDGHVVTRIPPEPSKYNHLGHALTFLMNALYAERYHGKVIVRFEDANPEKCTQEYVDMMIEDITGYLGITPTDIRFVSDDMDQLAAFARTLIERGGAYMCFCDRDTMGKNREEMRECACRQKPIADQLTAWESFWGGKWLRGEAVLRFMGDMASQNTVLRDPVLYRAIAQEHFRHGAKYKVWPTYDFYSGPEEGLCGVTHILRSNEFDLRVALQDSIKRILELPSQEVLQYGRFNVTGATTQGREIREGIAAGTYTGWDDPRLVTLKALRRRGIRRDAYVELIKQLGLSPYPINLDFSMLASANRQIVDPIAKRFSFVDDPVEIHIIGAPAREVTLHLHPDKKAGGRVFKTRDRYLVRATDHAQFGTQAIRLKDNLTFTAGSPATFIGIDVHAAKFGMNVNWLPADPQQYAACEVMMPDATVRRGLVERGILTCTVDEVVQLERFGFCRIDAIEDGAVRLWYTHD